jgi:TPR repeat protein
VDPDLDKARELYQKAANQGNVQAQYNLGVCYENGLGVEPDLPKAAKYYQEAADQGSQDAQDAIANLKQAVQDR